MKRTAGWLLVGALAVSGCAIVSGPGGRLPDDEGFDPVVVRAPQPTLPNVFVMNGHLVVDQEPIRLWLRDYDKEKRTVRIAWALAANSDTQWPDAQRGDRFKPGPTDVRLRGPRRGQEGSCVHSPVRAPRQVQVHAEGDRREEARSSLDPNIVNME